ncbi:MAG: type IX secretion system protein PorQ [Lunatimonas sp.]|uniref:type IX secretion system protein PorQ n=1 Tax=Lunatimonas sp. TaxID=2060141 RepID=UPI00263A7372|nr:type IX secretion system protein PorQ [Lunatimonas sp.]MCC5936422.1 type IX secretion system protein PorQ [Lunatimonas sp.]
MGTLCVWGSHPLLGQVSQSAFGFADQPTFTGLAGLGGVNITSGSDPLMFLSNPAMLDSAEGDALSAHYLHFPGDIQFATVGYGWKPREGWRAALGLQFANYGEFEGYDEVGFPLGTFHASEFALTAALGATKGVFRYGLNIKLMGSVLESYQAYALVADLGLGYHHPEQDLVIAITAKQVGVVLRNYLEELPLRLPSDVRVGISYKAEHMPVRFHLTARNLLYDTDHSLVVPSTVIGSGRFSDRLFRRLVLGAEVLVHESLELRAGYNYLVRQEFADFNGRGLGGFSGGLLFRAPKFALSYAISAYRVAGSAHLLGIHTNIQSLRKF